MQNLIALQDPTTWPLSWQLAATACATVLLTAICVGMVRLYNKVQAEREAREQAEDEKAFVEWCGQLHAEPPVARTPTTHTKPNLHAITGHIGRELTAEEVKHLQALRNKLDKKPVPVRRPKPDEPNA